MERTSPFGTIKLEDKDYSIDLDSSKAPSQKGYIIASFPLTNENWLVFQGGEMRVFARGELLYASNNMSAHLTNDELKVLKYIRRQPHSVNLRRLGEATGLSTEKTADVVKTLVNKQYIRQHSRDTVTWNHPQARYFTCEDNRAVIDDMINI